MSLEYEPDAFDEMPLAGQPTDNLIFQSEIANNKLTICEKVDFLRRLARQRGMIRSDQYFASAPDLRSGFRGQRTTTSQKCAAVPRRARI